MTCCLKLEIEMVVIDEDVSPVVDAIVNGAENKVRLVRKIFVFPIEDVIRVRTGDSGTSAV